MDQSIVTPFLKTMYFLQISFYPVAHVWKYPPSETFAT